MPPGGNRFDLQRNAPEITPDCWIRKISGGTDLFGRLWWDRPSVTIRTEFYKPEKGRYLHPVQHRPITHREAARLMGFPDDFRFCGTKVEIARQIGNAVPPPLAGALGRLVADMLAPWRRAPDVRRRAAAEMPDEAVGRIKRLLDNFLAKLEESDLRDQVRSLVPVFEALRGLGRG